MMSGILGGVWSEEILQGLELGILGGGGARNASGFGARNTGGVWEP